MRKLEHGKSMPSGDACAAAVCGGMYWHLFGFPWFMIVCVPFASLGRVYVHCHWIGDTVVGAIIGFIFLHYSY